MPTPDKPRHRSGYRREQTELVEAACLTIAVTLGALMEQLCIVGGLVPSLLIDRELGPEPRTGALHSGTNDLDIGLAVALLDDQQYAEISTRLRQEGFEPDRNERGNPTPQRWRLGNLNVTIDFLLPPIPGAERGGRVQPLEGDFGALIAPGLQLVFDERLEIEFDGRGATGHARRRARRVWHKHEETDDFFLVVSGHLTIHLRDRDIELDPGELFVVPRGVEHCPDAAEETSVLLIEPDGTVNTGDAEGELTAQPRLL